MILFVNVYLDENKKSPLGQPNYRYKLKDYDKQEIFLYTLESYKVINWSKVIIYCELSESIANQEDYYNKIINIFPDAILFKKRNAYQPDWQSAVEFLDQFDDDLIWYAGNHDHPYLAPNNNQLNKIVQALNDCDEPYKAAIYSHHPDNLSWISIGFDTWKYEGNSISSYYSSRAEGMMIVNKNTLRSWWFDTNYCGAFIPRADWIENSCVAPLTKIFLPVRLMCHHFDGYTFGSYMYDTNDVPPLEIPEGFWDNNIVIDYCSNFRRNNNVWINPLNEQYKAISEDGVDYRFTLDDIPLFWKKRISKIYKFPHNERQIRKARHTAIFKAAAARRYSLNILTQMKGVNWSEIKEFRPKISFNYLRDLLSLR